MPLTKDEMTRYVLELLEKVTENLTPEQKDRVIRAILLAKLEEKQDENHS